jgi:hypothetical protein
MWGSLRAAPWLSKLTTSSARYVTSANFSCFQNACPLAMQPSLLQNAGAAAQVRRAELGPRGAMLVDPRSWAEWVMRTFVLLGKFEATLLSWSPAHSPIALAQRRLSMTMVTFSSAAKPPSPLALNPLLVLTLCASSHYRVWHGGVALKRDCRKRRNPAERGGLLLQWVSPSIDSSTGRKPPVLGYICCVTFV